MGVVVGAITPHTPEANMRVDGGMKSITAGVTTLDDLRQAGVFAKEQVNWRSDIIEGLTRRPPATFVKQITTEWIAETDTIIPFELGTDEYWLAIQPRENTTVVNVHDKDGEPLITEKYLSDYFQTITGPNSISTVAIDDVLYIANKNYTVQKLLEVPEEIKQSMVVVKQAPQAFTQLKVSWENAIGELLTVVLTVEPGVSGWPAGEWQEMDLGTNNTALKIQQAMAVADLDSTFFVQGSTILIVRSDDTWANVATEDGAGDLVLAGINAETGGLENLPKYAPPGRTVVIRPDLNSDRGLFYMRAERVNRTDDEVGELPDPDFAMVAGAGSGNIRGYSNGTYSSAYGTLTPLNHKSYPVGIINSTRIAGVSGFEGLVSVRGAIPPEGDPSNWWRYLHIVDTVTGVTVLSTPLSYQIFGNVNQAYTRTYVDLLVGRTYHVYTKKVSGTLPGSLPEVIWREATAPEEDFQLDSLTLPHILVRRKDGSFLIAPQHPILNEQEEAKELGIKGLSSRTAGDNVTNEFPTFLGKKINALGRFQNRLVALSGSTVSMSVTGQPYNWFRGTVTQLLATSPINIRSTAQDASELISLVGHNNDVVIFSRTGQHKLSGSTPVTPSTAALPRSASYANVDSTTPVSIGNAVYFPTSYGRTAGISKYAVDPNGSDRQDIAESVTNHVHLFIPGDIELLAGSSNINMMVAKALAPNILYIYEYVESRDTPQNSWSTWELPDFMTIRAIRMINNEISIAVTSGPQGTTRITVIKLRVYDRPGHSGYEIFLDARLQFDDVGQEVILPNDYPLYDSLLVVQGDDCPEPYSDVNYTRVGRTLSLEYDMFGGTVWVGYRFESSYIPAIQYIRDDSNKVQTTSKLRITDFLISLTGAELSADIISPHYDFDTQDWEGKIYGDIRTRTDTPTVIRDRWRVSYKQPNTASDLRLHTQSYLPVTVHQIEWRGTYNKAGRRF